MSERAGVDLMQVVDISEFERLALPRIPEAFRFIVQGGAGSGAAIVANLAAWQRWVLHARMLVDVSSCDTSTTVLGQHIDLPVLIAPSGMQGQVTADGEVASARASEQAGTIMVLSMNASRSPEEVGAVGRPFWMQLYWGRDRGFVTEVVNRAAEAGATALCLTVDFPVRPWINGEMLAAWGRLGEQTTALQGHFFDPDEQPTWQHDASLTWSDLEWLQSISSLPVVLKGIMTAADAKLAVEHAVSAVVVSNHGGQAFEHGPATAEVLPEIVEAVGGRIELLVDGGIRNGGDVFRALALGARAVLIGRPNVWGLAVAGAAGAARVLTVLGEELETLMAQTGARTVSEIDRTMISRRDRY
jgi:4-hydroxymandelate oxidase